MLRVLTTGALLAPTGLLAQTGCPTAQEIAAAGVVFTYADGTVELHRETAPGVIAVNLRRDEVELRNTFAYGVHTLSLSAIADGRVLAGSMWSYSYEVGNNNLPRPSPGGSWGGQRVYSSLEEQTVETFSHSWGAMEGLRIGDCTYDAIPVQIDYSAEFYNFSEELMYLPSLGTALLSVYEDDVSRDVYTAVSVGLP